MKKGLTLCIIAKNEESCIERCLKSVEGVASQIVLCDTGSSDKTMEIAARYGATIIQTPWEDDFSTPKNMTIDAAEYEWILSLDADEELDPNSKIALKELVRDSSKELVYNVPIFNYVDNNNSVDHCNFRLFPNAPGVRFLNEVHETLQIPQTHKQASAKNIRIIHYGYLASEKIRKGTNERNLRILLKSVEKHPERYHMGYYIAQQYFIDSKLDLALSYYQKCLKDLTEHQCVETGIFTPLIMVAILKCHILMGNDVEVLKMKDVNTNCPDFYIELGSYFYNKKKYYDAVKNYNTAARMRYRKDLSSVYDSGSMTWKAYAAIGNVYVAVNDPIKAEDNFRLAYLYAPENDEIVKTLYSISMEGKDLKGAETYLNILIEKTKSPEYYMAMANIYLNSGRIDEGTEIILKYSNMDQILNIKGMLVQNGYAKQSERIDQSLKETGRIKVASHRATKNGPQFTIIIPTLMKAPDEVFQYTIDELSVSDLVDKIVILDNTGTQEFSKRIKYGEKIKLIDTEPAQGPNQCFNRGMLECNSKYYALINDDVLLHRSLVNDFYNVLEQDDNIGLVQALTYNIDLPNYVNSIKTFETNMNKPTSYFLRDDGSMTGWCMVGRKEEWVNIPESLKYFFGDNLIYINAEVNKRKIVKICSKFLSHLTSTTVKSLDLYRQGLLESELELFKQEFPKLFPGVNVPSYSIPDQFRKGV